MIEAQPHSLLQQAGINLDLHVVREEAHRPVGGWLQWFTHNWKQVTNDPWVLGAISGLRLELSSIPPPHSPQEESHFDQLKTQILTEEIKDLALKKAIVVAPEDGLGFISRMFLVPKADGSWRPVINLKMFNNHVLCHHFKMESIRTVKGLVRPGDGLLKLDPKDAYLTIPIHRTDQKYLRFRWQGRTWKFQVLPFGLNSAPQTFTKLTKPIVSTLRSLGVRLILYLDDMLLMADSRQEALLHLGAALEILVALGFVINTKKSVFKPSQELEFLGFNINTLKMRISLPHQKFHSLRSLVRKILNQSQTSTRLLARLLGMMVAAHPAILPAPLHFRNLEREKLLAVKRDPSYESMITITPRMMSDLRWWIETAHSHNGRPLQILKWDITIESDASLRGWGASCNGSDTGGPWTKEEQTHHINYLELLAAFLAMKSFLPSQGPMSVLLRMDNVTAIAFINRMGGTHSLENIRADWQSRHLVDSSDWRLDREIFLHLENQLGPFTIDLFASRTNAQLPTFCSWRPDPKAIAVDALSIPWKEQRAYMFPPFALIPRCLSKLWEEGASALLIAPVWPNQTWFPQVLRSLASSPVLLPPLPSIVTNQESQLHPLAGQGRLPLAAWPVSGDPTVQRAFQRELSISSGDHGGTPLSQPTRPPGVGGIAGVLKGHWIQFQLL